MGSESKVFLVDEVDCSEDNEVLMLLVASAAIAAGREGPDSCVLCARTLRNPSSSSLPSSLWSPLLSIPSISAIVREAVLL